MIAEITENATWRSLCNVDDETKDGSIVDIICILSCFISNICESMIWKNYFAYLPPPSPIFLRGEVTFQSYKKLKLIYLIKCVCVKAPLHEIGFHIQYLIIVIFIVFYCFIYDCVIASNSIRAFIAPSWPIKIIFSLIISILSSSK